MSWSNTVQTVGKWYQANIHDYNQGKYSACSIPNCGSVRHDCSGFVSACLRAAGVFKSSQIFSSGCFVGNGAAALALKKAGFTSMSYSLANLQPYDIVAFNGHVEIFAGIQNGSYKSWSWGSCHDGLNGHSGEPAYMADKNRYVTIWRSSENIGLASAQMDWSSSGSDFSGDGSAVTNNYTTYTSDIDHTIFASAMNNSFTPYSSLIPKDSSGNTKHTRIYSVLQVGIKVDELSMPMNEATIKPEGGSSTDISNSSTNTKK